MHTGGIAFSLLAVVLAVSPIGAVARQRGAVSGSHSHGSLVLPGAANNVPHLDEIGWGTDLPFLMTIRFLPEKLDFGAGWKMWSQNEMFVEVGLLQPGQPYPWPHFFVPNASRTLQGLSGLSPDDMQKFQDWSIKRAASLPPVIVHSIPFIGSTGPSEVTVRPLGIPGDEGVDDQQIEGVGFSVAIYLRLDRPANDYAVTIPPDVIAHLPSSGVRLETRVRWRDPEHANGTLVFVTHPISVRLVAGKDALWEHNY